MRYIPGTVIKFRVFVVFNAEIYAISFFWLACASAAKPVPAPVPTLSVKRYPKKSKFKAFTT